MIKRTFVFGEDEKKGMDLMVEFFNSERENVLAILMKKYGNTLRVEDLEDVVQEASVVLWKKVMEHEMRKKDMKNFLIYVCRNMIGHVLRGVVEVESYDGWEWEKMSEVEEEIRREEELQRRKCEMLEKLMDMWDGLKEGEKMVLRKFYWDGKSMVEIAREMNFRNEGVAKNLKCRALKMLKEMSLAKAA